MATSMKQGMRAVQRVVPLVIRSQTRPFQASSILARGPPCYRSINGQGASCRQLSVHCPTLPSSAKPSRCLSTSCQKYSETSDQPAEETEQLHNIIQDAETVTGTPEKHEFQAETKMLLDIVAKSLYSENEVFIRELISNASDALEKLRYVSLTSGSGVSGDLPLEIHIATNQEAGTITIQDTGIGMTLQEMIDNLGTIARSGSKAFLEELKKDGQTGSTSGSIVGQFGVGFYSAFMVADHMDVYSMSHQPGSKAYRWSSDGTGNYDIIEADGVQKGTKIVIHLKKDCWRFAMEADVKDIISKHSTFVGMPIFLNGKQMNTTQALWTKDPREVSDQQHEDFYQFLTHNSYDKPRYTLHYKTDAPLNIRSLFYVPGRPPAMWELSQDHTGGVALYSRRVLIQQKSDKILPKWFRFIQGVVDSEDIPLNLSRELLQDSALIRKLRAVITSRLVRFLLDQRKKDLKMYEQFFTEYGTFLREGIISASEQAEKEEIAKLLCFETSSQPAGNLTSLQDYASRMKAGQRNMYYICAPSRELAESSPYFEAFKQQDHEVLFCYAEYDELTMLQLREFDRKLLISVESEMAVQNAGTESAETETVEGSLTEEESDSLITYMKDVLGSKVANIKITQRLAHHPAMVTVAEMGAARHFLRTALKNRSEEEKLQLLQPTLELNGSHPIVQKLFALKTSEPALAKLLGEQVYDNAMIAAGLVDDPRPMLGRLNAFMEKTLEKY